MEGIPIEYLWHYNPVTGRVAGANQNYGERINILSSNRYLYNRMQAVQAARNAIVTQRGLQSLSGGCGFLPSLPPISETVELSNYDSLSGEGIGQEEKPDTVGSMQTNLADLVRAAEEAEARQQQNLTTERFVREFPPVVYKNPFSSNVFPQEFNPLFSPDGNQFSRPLHGGAVSLSGFYPKLRGGAVSLRGQDPALG